MAVSSVEVEIGGGSETASYIHPLNIILGEDAKQLLSWSLRQNFQKTWRLKISAPALQIITGWLSENFFRGEKQLRDQPVTPLSLPPADQA